MVPVEVIEMLEGKYTATKIAAKLIDITCVNNPTLQF